MKSALNIIFSLIIGGIPWINLIILLGDGINYKRTKQILWSSLFLFLEVALMSIVLLITPQSQHFGLCSFLLFLTFCIAFVYSIYTLIESKNDNVSTYLIISIICGIASLFYILVEIIITILACNEKKYKWMIISIAIIATNILFFIDILPNPLFFIVFLLNAALVFLWTIVAKNCYNMNLSSSKKFNVNMTFPTNSPHLSTRVNNEPINTEPKENEAIFDKGWQNDDTTDIEVDLLTIEDMINPLILKNEHEKAVKSLIVDIRKLNKYSEQEIVNTFGEKGFSAHLATFFSSLKLDAVRSVYIRSLHILLEDYSKRDSRIKVYSEKLLIK